MPQWDIEVANVFYIRLEADTQEEANQRACHRITGQGGHEQRVLKIERIDEDE